MGPSEEGTGKLITILQPMAEEREYRTYIPRMDVPFAHIIASRSLSGLFKECAKRIIQYVRLSFIRKSEIILVHPQTFGFQKLFRLHRKKNAIKLYIVDNSFFCIQSYNYRPNKPGECLDCLGNVDKCNAVCSPFPVNYPKKKNLAYLKKFQTIYRDFHFFVQNANQGLLLQKHFGADVLFRIIDLMTDEFVVPEKAAKDIKPDKIYDMVYHGNLVEAKGFLYAVKLAGYLPEYSLLIPSDKDEILRMFPGIVVPENVVCRNIRWKTGLKSIIEHSRLILCPSLWSAPIEGALIKSIIHNGNVAVYDTAYGFQREVPSDVLLRLNNDFQSSAATVRRFLNNSSDLSGRSRKWITDFINNNKVAHIFQ